MSIEAWFTRALRTLGDANVATARLDCLVMLEDVLNTNRTHILAHQERELTEVQLKKLDTMIAKRARHVPLAYIRGKTEFYGRVFRINDHVLEPRPESETIIEMLLKYRPPQGQPLIDIGTGSGALAITAALELPDNPVVATDIDDACLVVAKRNADKLNATLTFYHGSLLEALPRHLGRTPATLLCNLPYVPDNFQINTAATHEPHHAIFGGGDGLELYRTLFTQLATTYPGPTHLLCESLPPQHDLLTSIAQVAGFHQAAEADFIQLFVRDYSEHTLPHQF